jgi:hypothetical protein
MASSEARSETQSEADDSVRLMATAFDQVLERLPETVERSDDVRREVALFIVDRFRLGEHDPDRLSDLALAEVGTNRGEREETPLAPDADASSVALDGAHSQ